LTPAAQRQIVVNQAVSNVPGSFGGGSLTGLLLLP
jgi:hypothetical protein